MKLLQTEKINPDINDRLGVTFSSESKRSLRLTASIVLFTSSNGTAVIFDKHCVALQIGLTQFMIGAMLSVLGFC